jgi:uncharacterized membrane protein YgdD (TMEM256/DUF423 family)
VPHGGDGLIVASTLEPMQTRLAGACAALSGVNGALSIAAAAYGRHDLVDAYPREIVSIAANLQLAHAVALLGVAGLAEVTRSHWISAAGLAAGCFALGTVLFSATLYVLGLAGVLLLEGAAPAGGLLLMVGWLVIAFIGVRGLMRRRIANPPSPRRGVENTPMRGYHGDTHRLP